MSNSYFLSVELTDGTPVLPSNINEGNGFDIFVVPRKGEILEIESKRYSVEQIIHAVSPSREQTFTAQVSEI